ncbi:MAG: hypothetical protein JXE06_07265 [Coriobacteriia bacterium]|nr:hypothetical protein [Coriobacteriia bacterium]MBN2823160.1 hypothetical protein [Coriobacteriia bacterium]
MLTHAKRMRLWTYLFDPPVLAILTFIAFYISEPVERSLGACMVGVVCLGLIPLAAWLYMIWHPGDFRGERRFGFALSIGGYVAGTVIMVVFFRQYRLNMALMLSYMFTVVSLTLVNLLHYKASGHAAGAAGPAIAFAIMYGWLGLPAFLLLIFVALAKIGVKEHTLGQLCAGAASAAVSTIGAFAIMGVLRF